ncbi:monovalent cation/H+ antiporter complex subunit F [Ehrlichia canis]|uniref:monovalent cation/H+ antiporter complex subunit F n=2 Tax=Ehrlichia canis TaxID=944 RepID=UPI0005C64389|nr:monovalent cation/H+ antiporter complex subunit F [Ehrlichia canis]AUO54669.1 cation:proton antiporter [Ehrlichia canis]UKC53838.1 monovalent cation/H+ antiporter subunit F [Ehrlichia canis]UKC54773.1 monovalent cation/H+ antiporter subunit F [Ehrlichia canis]UKC55710.1 monovalent cation/H+ antiporter subunit F [Ehrlichia canis]
MLVFTGCVLLFCMGAMLICVATGNSIYDKILAANLFGTYSVVLIVVVGVINNTFSFLIDVSLVYACINFISTIAFMRFFLHGSFGKIKK